MPAKRKATGVDKEVRALLRGLEYRFRDTLESLRAIEDGRELATDPTESVHDRRDRREVLDDLLQRIADIRSALDDGDHWIAMPLLTDLGYRTGRADAWQDWRPYIQGLSKDQWQVTRQQRERGKKKKGKLKKAKRGVNVPKLYATLRKQFKNASALSVKKKVAKKAGLSLTTVKDRLSGK